MPRKWDSSKWVGMFLCLNDEGLYLGFGFSDKIVALDFWDTLFAWNDNESNIDDNIQISLVKEDEYHYSVYVYPTIKRKTLTDSFRRAMIDFDKKANAGKELDIYVAQMCFCKVFPMSEKCAYNYLLGYSGELTIRLLDASRVDGENPSTYSLISEYDNRKLILRKFSIAERNRLSYRDNAIEYYHIPRF